MGRPKKTWDECVGQDLRRLGLRRESAQDRMEWRHLIVGNRPTRAEHGKMDVVVDDDDDQIDISSLQAADRERAIQLDSKS